MSDKKAHQNEGVGGHRLTRRTKIILGIVGTLIALPLIAIVVLLNYDWNRARPWLNAKVSEAIERPFAIRGNLGVQWERPVERMRGADSSWRDAIPWPHLVANDVHVGNPAGLPARDMAEVGQFSFSLNPFSLLKHTIAIPVLRFDAPRVDLLRTDATHNNWTFKKSQQESRWKLDLERVVLAKGVLHLKDAVTKTELTADIDTLENNRTYGIGWTVRGTYRGAPLSGRGKAGGVLSLKQQSTPYPIQAELHGGPTRVSIEGTVTRPAQLAAIDLHLKLASASMADLYDFTGVLLPKTPPFSTEGRLLGAIDDNSSRWTYDKFKGKVGSSDIGGRLVYQSGKPRPMLSGEVVSRQLVFADLGPVIGANSGAKPTGPVPPAGKVLPVESFQTERWTAIDADVRYAAERIIRDKQLPISKLSTHLTLKNGVVTLDPLTFGVAGGTLKSTIRMDGSGREGKRAIRATAKVTARHIEIKQLFPTIEKMQATVGQINGDAQLSAVGNSVASLLGSSNGELKTLVNQGAVSKMLLEQMGLNVGNIILTKLFGDKQVQLNCMATDFAVTNGLMRARYFVVDTDEAVITVDGTINLANEQLDLTLHPQTKALRIFSLRAPLYVRGPFSKPDVSVDKGVLAMKAGGAAVLAAVAAPAAALLPLINTGPGKDSKCGELLAAARVKPTAPPPGQTRAPGAAKGQPALRSPAHGERADGR
ncbi:MAG TPA: AsmA family protein [Telluria sp.]